MRSVLVLARHYAPEPTGSAPPMQQLAEGLARTGLKVELITSRPSYPGPKVFDGYAHGERDNVVEGGVHVRRLPTFAIKRGGLLARVLPEARFMAQLLAFRLIRRTKPDEAVISLCPSILTVFAATVFRTKGSRHVVIVHDLQSGLGTALGSRLVRGIMGLLRRIEHWSLSKADHLVVLSAAMGQAVKDLGVQTPFTILPPQVDCSAITPQALPEGSPLLMYSGNLGRKQGLDQVLDLAAVLKERAPEVRIVIRGEGVVKPHLEERIERERLHNVDLQPLVPREQVASSLASATIHLVPQIAEGGDYAVPSKAFSIMAAARPFITTATADNSIARLASESGAFVVTPPNDAKRFADAVLALLSDPLRAEQMSRLGRAYAETHADSDVVMQRVLALLFAQGADDASGRR